MRIRFYKWLWRHKNFTRDIYSLISFFRQTFYMLIGRKDKSKDIINEHMDWLINDSDYGVRCNVARYGNYGQLLELLNDSNSYIREVANIRIDEFDINELIFE